MLKSKQFIFLISTLLLINLFGSVLALDSLGTFKQDQAIRITQVCQDATYINISSISYPNSSIAVGNTPMISAGNGEYYYIFASNNIIGRYDVRGISDGCDNTFAMYFDITSTGDSPSGSQGYIVLAQLGIIALFTVLGFSFSKEKWKIRTFFFIIALLMGVITLNSIRIIAGTSNSLNTMGNIGLIVGIVIVSFMFLYMLIFYTIEIFKQLRNKREMRWQV
jgi:hypothetical protein